MPGWHGELLLVALVVISTASVIGSFKAILHALDRPKWKIVQTRGGYVAKRSRPRSSTG